MSVKQQPVSVEQLSVVTLVVSDQAAALEWYEDTLGFEKRSDSPFEMDGVEGRWLTMAPRGNSEVEIALVELDEALYDEESLAALEAMRGRDAWWTFVTADLHGTLDALREMDVPVDDELRETEWGTFAMISDPDGNRLQLYEPAEGMA